MASRRNKQIWRNFYKKFKTIMSRYKNIQGVLEIMQYFFRLKFRFQINHNLKIFQIQMKLTISI